MPRNRRTPERRKRRNGDAVPRRPEDGTPGLSLGAGGRWGIPADAPVSAYGPGTGAGGEIGAERHRSCCCTVQCCCTVRCHLLPNFAKMCHLFRVRQACQPVSRIEPFAHEGPDLPADVPRRNAVHPCGMMHEHVGTRAAGTGLWEGNPASSLPFGRRAPGNGVREAGPALVGQHARMVAGGLAALR